MSTYSDLVTAIKTRLDTVSGVGVTHAYQRYADKDAAFLDMFKTTISTVDQIRGWVVTMDENNPIQVDRFGLSTIKRTYNFLVWGVLGFSDANNTESTFFSLAESVMDALEGRLDFGVSGVYMVLPVAMTRYQVRTFGTRLCHYGELVVPVLFDKAVTYVRG